LDKVVIILYYVARILPAHIRQRYMDPKLIHPCKSAGGIIIL